VGTSTYRRPAKTYFCRHCDKRIRRLDAPHGVYWIHEESLQRVCSLPPVAEPKSYP
jgi:hypothetical protein